MPYKVTWEDRGVYRCYYGHTTDLEVSQSVYETASSPLFDEIRYVILDCLRVTQFELINPSFIEERAAVDSAAAMSNPNIKVAIVATDPEIIKLAEEYAKHELTPYPTQIYSSLEDARAWTEISLPLVNRFHRIR